jgi:hypothetical protein
MLDFVRSLFHFTLGVYNLKLTMPEIRELPAAVPEPTKVGSFLPRTSDGPPI